METDLEWRKLVDKGLEYRRVKGEDKLIMQGCSCLQQLIPHHSSPNGPGNRQFKISDAFAGMLKERTIWEDGDAQMYKVHYVSQREHSQPQVAFSESQGLPYQSL